MQTSLKVIQGWPCLVEHAQHLAPQILGADCLEVRDLSVCRHRFVLGVAGFELFADQVMQVGCVARAEEGPVSVVGDAFHKQVRNPVGRVHIVCAPPVVAGVLAQFQEFLDVQMPGFEISAHGALALATLVDGDGRVIGHLEERHHALGAAVGALDVRAHGANPGPIVAKAAGEFGQHGIVLDGTEDAVQIVWHGGQIARGQLRGAGCRS